ncbi:MAG TPA: DUF3634 family protein [Polyangiaceae bacterium]|nr:DUF3634 family protein [Polyangiaceae bacterium]HNZ20550.1 DUF3634 family protein [Polyangiaceae bacterium]HOD20834.1 DUF3634 family protein [Polyangiaceae bacterium]HOE47254.1 DUF3634 family protein [Polyangiaceae bacterium]HOG99080.1 DUF3634 family protein [Polyangiaceae bacterium]
MTTAVILGLAVLALGIMLVMNRNATLLFSAKVQRGRIVSLRGRAPKKLVRELNDVLGRRPVPSASLRVYAQGDRAALQASGDLNENEMQRLRNVLGTFPTARIRSEPFRKQ